MGTSATTIHRCLGASYSRRAVRASLGLPLLRQTRRTPRRPDDRRRNRATVSSSGRRAAITHHEHGLGLAEKKCSTTKSRIRKYPQEENCSLIVHGGFPSSAYGKSGAFSDAPIWVDSNCPCRTQSVSICTVVKSGKCEVMHCTR